MKLFVLLFLSISTVSQAQDNSVKFKAEFAKADYINHKDVKSEIIPFDIAPLFTRTGNTAVFGFIGSEFERIRVKLVSVIKNKDQQDQYLVYGKTMVKDNVCEFQGTLKVTSAYYLNESGNADVKQGIVVGDYTFYENPSQKHVGLFKGSFSMAFYVDKQGLIQYDDLMGGADGFSNSEFVGTWQGYNGKPARPCNWGDYRIPMSGDLDIGTGDFSPAEKYTANGWLNYKQAYHGGQDKALKEAARKKENAEWWK